MTASVDEFIATIETQRGDVYVFGAEARFSDPNPRAFDCSELVEWGCARVGVPFVDGAANQLGYCRVHRTVIPLATAFSTFGALLFRVGAGGTNHVAVSLGNSHTFEARGRAYGVNEFSALGRVWTAAARIPGLDYTHRPIVVPRPPSPEEMELTPDERAQLAEAKKQATEANNRASNLERWLPLIAHKLGITDAELNRH